ncbi:hypothetical protein [Gracilibacillus salinarum]|uniref:Uncharacterized protein n=1 Tax=Gracilibacillus salinarum TaxID=2932255 RepID=A0ABY4GUE2_9BACI|nr:hypothetical protein [Gracilibacillus salinarum]UOQ87287.1 hypothetical protein MUN87_10545 [Gracilibacillus salinarum]
MHLYFTQSKYALKSNFMLIVMAAVLMTLTFFIWAGIPVFIVGNFVSTITSSVVIVHFFISLTSGILSSLFFIPFHVKVARQMAAIKNRTVLQTFIRIEAVCVCICSTIFESVLIILIV